MPVPLTSRNRGVPIARVRDASGVSRPTIGVRPFAPLDPDEIGYRHVITGADTLESLAWRFYGTSDYWWRIADANLLVFPLDPQPGSGVNVPAADAVGRVDRTRSF
jgi:hypothetical protein